MTLLFAHLQTCPWTGSIPVWLSVDQGWCSSHSHAQAQGGEAESRSKLKALSPGYPPAKVLQIQRKWDKEGQRHGWGHFPVPTSEEDGERIGGLSPIAEPACCSHLPWAPMMGIGTDLPCKDTQAPGSLLRQPNPMG